VIIIQVAYKPMKEDGSLYLIKKIQQSDTKLMESFLI
jgi:hypothetical protein